MNVTFTVLLYAVAAGGLLASFSKDKERTGRAVKKAASMFRGVFPHFLAILLMTGVFLTVLTPQTIEALIGESSGLPGMILSALTGAVALVPVLAVFPVVSELLGRGAGIAQMAIFISALTTVGIATLPLEIKYLGRRAALCRNLFCLLAAGLTSLAMEVIMG